MRKIVRESKEAGLVTETDSEYASLCLLVAKENFPLPNIDDGLECISGATIFATLDLAHGICKSLLPKRRNVRLHSVPLTRRASLNALRLV